MFPYMSNIQNGIYSTRLYILSLIIGIIILIFYASISNYATNITVYNPTMNEYQRLYSKYSSTLVCPCTQLSIPYSTFMSIQPRYHQVCSSDFVRNDAWLLYVNGHTTVFFALDFRIVGIRLFTILQTLCKISKRTVSNQLAVFNERHFLSTHLLTNSTFHIQTSILIEQFQEETISTFMTLFDIVDMLTSLNQFIVNGNTNARLESTYNDEDTSRRFLSRNDYDNSCSCGLSRTCKRSQGFYCTSAAAGCFRYLVKPNYTIPGLYLNCLPVDSLLLSTLECFYNASCIKMVIDWNSFAVTNYTIDPRVANVTSLDPMINSRFLPNTILSKISSQLFIEDWSNFSNFSSYYNQCSPNQCTYTYEERFSIGYIISILLAVVGGLSVALRILSPFFIKFIRKIYHRCCNAQFLQTQRQTNVKTRLITRIRRSIVTMNFYRKVRRNSLVAQALTADEMLTIQRQQIASRFYLILLLISIVIISIYSALDSQTYTITVTSPSESTFELLKNKYSSTFSCPCSQIANRYSKFVFLEISSYHQICSSYFITYDFYSSLWGSDTASSYYGNIDLKILSSQFRLLSSLCTITKNIINQQIENFLSQQFVTFETLTRNSFERQINTIVQNFILQTPVYFRRTHQYVIDMFHTNQLHNIFYTNWELIFSSSNENYVMLTRPKFYNNTDQSCSCDTSSTCSKSLLVNRYQKVNLSGLVLGCLPSYGLRLSTLKCLYDSICLSRLADFTSMWNVPDPLDISLPTRFKPVSSVTFATLIDQLFIETWQNSTDYSNYFLNCAPLTCQYSYTKRTNVLYMLTTFLGIYGGLTVGLKFFIWYILIIYWKIRQWFNNRQRQIQPVHLN